MNDERNYLSTREAAHYLGLSARTLNRYRVSGDGPVFHRFGGRVRYRLTLTPSDRDSVQILIRNGAAVARGVDPATATAGADPRIGSLPRTRSGVRGRPRVAALVEVIRAVARREPPAGYAIETGTGRAIGGLPAIETWRGRRYTAHVVEGDGAVTDAADLAGTMGIRAAAAWLAAPGTGPSGGRLAVIVTDAAGPANAMPANAIPNDAMPADAFRGGPQ